MEIKYGARCLPLNLIYMGVLWSKANRPKCCDTYDYWASSLITDA
jgi:hypothetical protein